MQGHCAGPAPTRSKVPRRTRIRRPMMAGSQDVRHYFPTSDGCDTKSISDTGSQVDQIP